MSEVALISKSKKKGIVAKQLAPLEDSHIIDIDIDDVDLESKVNGTTTVIVVNLDNKRKILSVVNRLKSKNIPVVVVTSSEFKDEKIPRVYSIVRRPVEKKSLVQKVKDAMTLHLQRDKIEGQIDTAICRIEAMQV
jgi:hypothetical protein